MEGRGCVAVGAYKDDSRISFFLYVNESSRIMKSLDQSAYVFLLRRESVAVAVVVLVVERVTVVREEGAVLDSYLVMMVLVVMVMVGEGLGA